MNIKVNKELYSNLRDALEVASTGWVYDIDEAASTFIYETWNDDYKSFQQSFSYDGTVATLVGDPTEVILKNEVKVVKSVEDSLLDKVTNLIDKAFGGTNKPHEINEALPVIKQFEDEEMIEISKVYCSPHEVDAHNDAMDELGVEVMVSNINKAILNGNLESNIDHKDTTDGFHFIKAWSAECDCTIGGVPVPEGTPLIKVKFTDELMWNDRKEGEYTGWSIGAKATSFEYR